MRFSRRTNWNLAENDFARAVRGVRAAGVEVFDLTVSNPTACGFAYDSAALLGPLSDAQALVYEPEPLGMVRAREAVCGYYREHGVEIGVERVCLTTSTSEAYSFLFRLLCDPGDEVLIARPSYPLFEFLAELDDVRLVEYPLLYDAGWHVDFYALEAAVTAKTKAVVVVHPNNPTGNFTSEKERAALQEFCARRGLALIVDEVFLDYALESVETRSFAAEACEALTFVLSGLSKVCGLPQMKVSWIVAGGPGVDDAMARLEVIADTFLSVNAPMQFALPQWLAGRGAMQREIRERVRRNLAVLDARLVGTMVSRMTMQGGWAAVLRVPREVAGESFVTAAMERGVIVQPGEFYGLPEGRVVVSLLTPLEIWTRGLERLPAG
jgi:alanine-synthesizing transaminase